MKETGSLSYEIAGLLNKMKQKKAESMPIAMLIAAIMLLAAAIIAIYIYTSQTGKFVAGVNDCKQNAGDCVSANECGRPLSNFKCDKGKVCCIAKSGVT